mgnify:CR=1 FL=1
MASPKHKKSKMRKRQRVAQLEKAILASVQACPVCGGMKQAHHVCPQCGTYKTQSGAEVVVKLVD